MLCAVLFTVLAAANARPEIFKGGETRNKAEYQIVPDPSVYVHDTETDPDDLADPLPNINGLDTSDETTDTDGETPIEQMEESYSSEDEGEIDENSKETDEDSGEIESYDELDENLKETEGGTIIDDLEDVELDLIAGMPEEEEATVDNDLAIAGDIAGISDRIRNKNTPNDIDEQSDRTIADIEIAGDLESAARNQMRHAIPSLRSPMPLYDALPTVIGEEIEEPEPEPETIGSEPDVNQADLSIVKDIQSAVPIYGALPTVIGEEADSDDVIDDRADASIRRTRSVMLARMIHAEDRLETAIERLEDLEDGQTRRHHRRVQRPRV